MDDQIYFLKPDKVKVPVKPQVFKHGGGFYLAMVNHEAGVHIPFLAAAATLINELREILRVIEGAHNGNDQGHVSRKDNPHTNSRQPTLADLNGDPRHDFAVFVRRFAKSSPDIVAAIAQVYKTKGYKVPGIDAILQGYDDLDLVWAIRLKVVNANGELVYGGRNRIGKALGIRDAGNYRGRIDTVIWLLKHNSDGLLEDFGVTLGDNGTGLGVSEPKVAVSNAGKQRVKAA